jgi:hypothetical protein
MTAPVGSQIGTSSFLPTAVYPTLPLTGLSEDEARAANALAMRLFNTRPYLELRGLYYDGLQKMQDLGISIPPSLAGLRTVMGWPQIGVDAVDERCIVQGFRLRRPDRGRRRAAGHLGGQQPGPGVLAGPPGRADLRPVLRDRRRPGRRPTSR